MRYKIYDNQCKDYFSQGEIFKSKKEIIERLANYHDIDFADCEAEDNNGKVYDDIFEYLKLFKTDKEKLDFLCDYGEWEIDEIKKGESNG